MVELSSLRILKVEVWFPFAAEQEPSDCVTVASGSQSTVELADKVE